MVARAGKYPHAAVYPLLGHYIKEDGGTSYPVVAMVIIIRNLTEIYPVS